MAKSAAQPARIQTAQDLTGVSIGRFVVRRLLGSGGMGQVYQAEDTRLKRPVALKRMAPQLSTDEHYRRRFLKEAECASQLTHEHIAGIYDVFEENGEIFLVMEYVGGETLRERLARPVALDELLDIAIQCATALVAAQNQEIVHRDLKPENIMLTPARQVKILDFGLAKVMPRADGSTTQEGPSSTGGMAGTPAYMAPESLLEKRADGRSDIFSLGVTLYETLTGQHPFLADSFLGTAERILHHSPPPANFVSPKVPAELARIINKMINKDSAERYATSADLLVDLRALQRATAFPVLTPAPLPPALLTPAPPPVFFPTPAAVSEPPKKKSRTLWVLSALVIALGVGAYLSWPKLQRLVSLWRSDSARHAVSGNAANPAAASPEGAAKSAENPPGTSQSQNSASVADSHPGSPPVATPGARRENPTGPAPNPRAAKNGEPDPEKDHTTAGKGEMEVIPDVLGARAVLTSPDGVSTQECTTPCSFQDLKPGRYTMEISKVGYRTLRRIVQVQANKIISENQQLAPLRGAVVITSEPSQAEVFINGQRYSELTPTTIALAPGKYTIAVQKAGFERHESSVEMKDEGFGSVLPITLQPLSQAVSGPNKTVGRVVFRTVPLGADILVDGKDTGHRTPDQLELPAGRHTVRLFLKGFKDVQETITVEKNQTFTLNRVLPRL